MFPPDSSEITPSKGSFRQPAFLETLLLKFSFPMSPPSTSPSQLDTFPIPLPSTSLSQLDTFPIPLPSTSLSQLDTRLDMILGSQLDTRLDMILGSQLDTRLA
jgi:hypothetical protein